MHQRSVIDVAAALTVGRCCEQIQNFNSQRFGSLAAFMAFRLCTFRFFKFKQECPNQLFCDEVHEAVPGSPLEAQRTHKYAAWSAVAGTSSAPAGGSGAAAGRP